MKLPTFISLTKALWLTNRSLSLSIKIQWLNSLTNQLLKLILLALLTSHLWTRWLISKLLDLCKIQQKMGWVLKTKCIMWRWKTLRKKLLIIQWNTKYFLSSLHSFALGRSLLMGSTNSLRIKGHMKFMLNSQNLLNSKGKVHTPLLQVEPSMELHLLLPWNYVKPLLRKRLRQGYYPV